MFDSIIQTYQESIYDFRDTANLADPLNPLFEQWVPYYRLKFAVAAVLNPATILEIGVRYGYSARAFLEGAPRAHYVGIDLDSDTFRGTKGAIAWAHKLLESYSADLIIADSQQMNRFPGSITYDLIHIDGQQDGKGSVHDLELAIRQGCYILVDGHHWTRQNYLAINDFLIQYRDLLDWYGTIPGYAGELLIKVAQQSVVSNSPQIDQPGSLALRDTYTTIYYTQDCGGYDVFARTHGKRLEDPRLRSVASIAQLKQKGRMLDLGSGRGELAYYFAHQGYEVTAVDYSAHAVALAESCFEDEPDLRRRVQFYCDSVCTVELPDADGTFDLAIASDLVEHLSPQEVEMLYKRVGRWLKPQGLFVVHTFPNLWYYRYHYALKCRIANSVGAWLPEEPRSRYERLMHINEQSPRVLKRQLSQVFRHVILWFGDTIQPGGSLLRRYSQRELAAAPSLFAVASQQPVEPSAIIEHLQMPALSKSISAQFKCRVLDVPAIISTKQWFEVQVQLSHPPSLILNSYPPHPIHLSYHWLTADGNQNVIFDGHRTPVFFPKREDSATSSSMRESLYTVKVMAPTEPNLYRLRMTLVQEFICWFDSLGVFHDLQIQVR